jgi:hypothetical protein
MQVDGDRLVVRVDTTAPDGGPLTRTLTWRRLASGPPSRHAAGAAADA